MKIILDIHPNAAGQLEGLESADMVDLNVPAGVVTATVDGFKRDGRTSSRLVDTAAEAV
jgi:hypothetical protein